MGAGRVGKRHGGWLSIDCKASQPLPPLLRAPRYNHCALFDEDNNRLVVFGGRNAERKRLNDIHFLDLATFTWWADAMPARTHTCLLRPACQAGV